LPTFYLLERAEVQPTEQLAVWLLDVNMPRLVVTDEPLNDVAASSNSPHATDREVLVTLEPPSAASR
jgi:hypothetical protein